MADEKPLKITLKLAGKSYRLTIKREKEELYRLAEREINTIVARVARQQFEDFTTQDCLAMAALQAALSNAELTASRSLDSEELQRLGDLGREVDDYLNTIG